MSDFVSPFISNLSVLVKSETYPSLCELYDLEEKKILKELGAAKDDRALTICQGKYKMLKIIRHLPEETIDKYLSEKTNEK